MAKVELANKILIAMNGTQDDGLLNVYKDALDELGICYRWDEYIGTHGEWVWSSGQAGRFRY